LNDKGEKAMPTSIIITAMICATIVALCLIGNKGGKK
jgi:hypothetical protein